METYRDESTGTDNYNPNDTVGEYILQERLGGEHSSTFRAVHKLTQQTVAIKIFLKSLLTAKGLYNAELNALKVLRGLRGILQPKDNNEDNRAYFIVTEFIEEGSLRNVFNKYPEGMNIEEVLQIFRPIADTVDQIHGRNIIHRDLKPENVLFRKTASGYETFITDFGFVKFTDDSKSFHTETTAGTPSYIAPEAWIDDSKVTKTNAVDIYSVGVMLYEALEGKVPFNNPTDALNFEVPMPERTRQGTNAEVTKWLLRALSKNPKERPLSVGEITDSMQSAYYGPIDNEDRKWIRYKVDRYTIEEILSRGKMGLTMRARDDMGEQFILKAFESNSLIGNPKQLFDKEVESLKRLENGHGVLIPRESFSQKGIFFIVMDYQPGGSLRKLLNENRKGMDLKKLLEVFTQIAEAIDYTHSRRIIHRDIKPENVVYRQEDGRITTYLTDFGIAEMLEGTKSSFYTKTAAGTFYYMAPEAWNPSARKTKAMDIYSFGIMLYEALEGHPPFNAAYPAIILQHLDGNVPDPKNTLKKGGPGAKNILLEALAKHPEDRPKTAKEIIEKFKGQHPDYLGKKYGKYEIENIIGQSAIGATYKAVDTTNRKRKVALKTLPFSEPIYNEIKILSKLKGQEGILPFLDSGSANGVHYLVTEYMSGGNLRDFLQDYPDGMTLEEALEFFKPIAIALDYLHKNDIVHRDLKPENILLKSNKANGETKFRPYITDFGISRVLEQTPNLFTKTSVIAGTYKYIAPEVWDDQGPSPANDIYALGIMLYEALEGEPPFNARTPASIMKQHVNDIPPRPKNLSKRGDGVVNALLKSLDKKPERRQKSAIELILELENGAKTYTGPVSNPLIRSLKFSDLISKNLVPFSILILLPLLFVLLSLIPVPLPISSTATPTLSQSPTVTQSPKSTATLTSSPPTTRTPTSTRTRTGNPMTPSSTKRPGEPDPSTNPDTSAPVINTSAPVINTSAPVINTTAPVINTTVPPPPTSTPSGPRECNDGIDNDGDGQIDGSDPECSSNGDNDESR